MDGNGALTEDTDISFKIMQSGLIALAYNSEAFQQEPETKSYYMQRETLARNEVFSSPSSIYLVREIMQEVRSDQLFLCSLFNAPSSYDLIFLPIFAMYPQWCW